MRKAAFFIDGFNLYHSIDNDARLRKYKWLNLWQLCSSLLMPNDMISEVSCFTAYTDWNAERKARHMDYVAINEAAGCQIILGKFLQKDRVSMVECGTPCLPTVTQRFCKKKYVAHEEKMTDVNIAVAIVKACALGTCEAIYLVSGDNDLVPALDTARQINPNVRLRLIIPINARAKNLMRVCQTHSYKYAHIKEKHLAAAQFPDPYCVKRHIQKLHIKRQGLRPAFFKTYMF